jgi:phosphoglucosamine mutase
MTKFPQKLVNVKLRERVDVTNLAPVQAAVAEVERKLDGQGRVLLRPSGTEPLIRVMVEGREAQQVDELAHFIADAVRSAIASPAERAA